MADKKFFIEFGRLLYAIAMADGEIQKREVEKIHEIIRKELVGLRSSKDEFGTDKAFYAEFEFDLMAEQGVTVNDAINSFLSYVKLNPTKVSDEMKAICIDSVIKVADAYRGVNKAEQEVIERIKKELSK